MDGSCLIFKVGTKGQLMRIKRGWTWGQYYNSHGCPKSNGLPQQKINLPVAGRDQTANRNDIQQKHKTVKMPTNLAPRSHFQYDKQCSQMSCSPAHFIVKETALSKTQGFHS